VAPYDNEQKRRRWRVKDTSYSPWRDLPGIYTTAEMWNMRMEGFFAAAIPADETPPKEAASDD
jgi:hypothetical protein